MNKLAPMKGFTIVELLIVIVIIGILAAIVIVTYTGIQSRAINASMISAFDQDEKALVAYAEEYGDYPQPTDVDPDPGSHATYVCLEESADLPATSQLTAGACATEDYVTNGVSNHINTELKKIITNIPNAANYTVSMTSASLSIRGIFLEYGVAATPVLGYYVTGNQTTCGRGTAQVVDGENMTFCYLVLSAV